MLFFYWEYTIGKAYYSHGGKATVATGIPTAAKKVRLKIKHCSNTNTDHPPQQKQTKNKKKYASLAGVAQIRPRPWGLCRPHSATPMTDELLASVVVASNLAARLGRAGSPEFVPRPRRRAGGKGREKSGFSRLPAAVPIGCRDLGRFKRDEEEDGHVSVHCHLGQSHRHTARALDISGVESTTKRKRTARLPAAV